ncbi:DgyrCDS13196 [Dimorphilus gyrociliatus]|uniref:DgyrCDS13196 n=1 Tax=Dimorphilus gyrociliatus TaxID=2664684 RepID=A0A7I8W9Y5_9ANNE|nr:DgyrCDS13196 [Dimorphilus gyrociliatus]
MLSGRRYLLEAASKGDMELLDYALGQPYSFTDLNEALLRSCSFGHNRCTRKLLSYGADVNTVDADGDSPLMLAAANDHYIVAKLLVAIGAKINHTSDRGRTALHAAVWNQRRELVKLLINFGADVGIQELYGETAVMLCARRGFPDILRILLRVGCDIGVKSDEQDTALHYAARYNHPSCVEQLLSHDRTSVDAKNMWGYTPLMLAILYSCDKTVQLLLDSGASPIERDQSERTALFHAVSKDRSVEIIQRLVSYQNINVPDRYTVTPLMAAVHSNYTQPAAVLLQHGADVHRTSRVCIGGNFDFWTVAQVALYRENVHILEMVLYCGADIMGIYKFLSNEDNALRVSRNEKLVETVCFHLSCPQALKDMSRIVIRKALGTNVCESCKYLPIPPLLQAYIINVE